MKKIILTLCIIFSLSLASKAQEFDFKKGDFLLEGTLQASSETGGMENYEKRSSFGFHPQLGYFISDKWAVGVFAGFGNQKFEDKPESSLLSLNSNYVTLGLFGRYYFLDLGKRFKTFASVQTSYDYFEQDFPSDFDEIKRHQYSTRAGIGANFFITKNISIAYTFTDVLGFNTYKYEGQPSSTSFAMNLNNFGNIFSSGAFSLGFKF